MATEIWCRESSRNSLTSSGSIGLSNTSAATLIRTRSSPRCKTLISIAIAPLVPRCSVRVKSNHDITTVQLLDLLDRAHSEPDSDATCVLRSCHGNVDAAILRVLEYYRFRPKTHGSENNALTFLKLKSKTGNGP